MKYSGICNIIHEDIDIRNSIRDILGGINFFCHLFKSYIEINLSSKNEEIFLVQHSQLQEFLKLCKKMPYWVPIVAISDDFDLYDVVDAASCGIIDFLIIPFGQNANIERFIESVKRISLLRFEKNEAALARYLINNLSHRQRQILFLVAAGNSNKDISKCLNISTRTVEVHRRIMLDKLSVNSSAHAVRYAIVSGLFYQFDGNVIR